ncbi:MAG: hypothetical protein OXC06_14155 [Acidimicrobiaceae bacterium]|nr:hypothetical protein [Acidimicrobiaceae bacterium]
MAPQRRAVLDAWPIVRQAEGIEPADEAIRELWDPLSARRFAVSVVNLTEAWLGVAAHDGVAGAEALAIRLERAVDIDRGSEATAKAAAWIAHAYDVSLGGAYAAATAMGLEAELWTGDPQLLCEERIWNARDVRSESQRRENRVQAAQGLFVTGRRAGVLPGASTEQLAEIVRSHLFENPDRWLLREDEGPSPAS